MSTVIVLIVVGLLAWLARFAIRFHSHRRAYATLPGPPHSYIFGHLKVIDEALKELPPGLHMNVVMMHIAQKYDLKEAWYLDIWPASSPFMIIASADIAQQMTVEYVLPKHPLNKEFLGDMTGDNAIITLEGQEWKAVKSVIGPSYAPSNVLALVPIMLQSISLMCDRLAVAADQDTTIKLQHYLTNMTIDVIGYAALGIDLDAQRNPHPLATDFKRMVVLSATGMADPLAKYKNGFQFWQCTRRITNEVKKAIKTKWEETEQDKKATSKTTIDLILSAIRDGSPMFSNPFRILDKTNLNLATDQIKTLLLGGHDTSSATLSYAICLLSQHPEVLSRLRAEHSRFVTPIRTRAEAINTLTSNPLLLTNLPYTAAVLKETMRLYPTSSTSRIGSPTSPLQTVTTKHSPSTPLPLSVPNARQNIYIPAWHIHHDPKIFSDPFKFIPDRFLPDSDYAKAHPFPSYAWRPFEKGPRACIGMELALVEMRVVLVMLVREFEFEPRYPKDAPKAPESLGGEVWYQTMEFAAKPIGGMPVGVKRRNTKITVT